MSQASPTSLRRSLTPGGNRARAARRFVPMSLTCTAIVGLMLALGLASVAQAEQVVVRDQIFGSREAADMVMKARSYNPRFAQEANRDREKARALYEKAMALQPGAKINAALANRIAQMYAWYANPAKGTRPEPATAAYWWRRCINETNRRQLLWGHAHMGLGCASFLSGKPCEAAAALKAILELDVLNVEWPAWKVKPNVEHESARRCFELEMIRVRDRAEQMQIKAVDTLQYVLVRTDGASAVSALVEIAAEYEGLPVGAHARRLAGKTLKDSRASLYRYRGLDGAALEDLLGQAAPPASATASDKTSTPAGGRASEHPEPSGSPAEDVAQCRAVGEPDRTTTRNATTVVAVIASVVATIAVAFLARRAIRARWTR